MKVSIPISFAQCKAPITLDELPEHERPITSVFFGSSILAIVSSHLINTLAKPWSFEFDVM